MKKATESTKQVVTSMLQLIYHTLASYLGAHLCVCVCGGGGCCAGKSPTCLDSTPPSSVARSQAAPDKYLWK